MEGTAPVSDGNSAAAVSSGPATFADAFASDASSASDTTQAPTTPPAAAQPETPAQDSSQQPADDPRSPFIPRPRFDEVNTKLNELKAWREQYAWAEKVNPQELQQATQLARTLSANPVEGLQQLIAEIRKDPQYDAQLRSLAARALSQRSPAAPAEPQMVKVQLEDGSVVDLPRDPAQWLAHQKQQWMTELDQKIQPLQQTHDTLQKEREAYARSQQIEHFTSTTFADVQTWPGMGTKEAQAKLGAELAKAADFDPNDPREVSIALHTAYRRAIVPTLQTSAQSQLLDSLKTKAAASTSVNPGSAAPSAPRAITKFAQLGPDAWR